MLRFVLLCTLAHFCAAVNDVKFVGFKNALRYTCNSEFSLEWLYVDETQWADGDDVAIDIYKNTLDNGTPTKQPHAASLGVVKYPETRIETNIPPLLGNFNDGTVYEFTVVVYKKDDEEINSSPKTCVWNLCYGHDPTLNIFCDGDCHQGEKDCDCALPQLCKENLKCTGIFSRTCEEDGATVGCEDCPCRAEAGVFSGRCAGSLECVDEVCKAPPPTPSPPTPKPPTPEELMQQMLKDERDQVYCGGKPFYSDEDGLITLAAKVLQAKQMTECYINKLSVLEEMPATDGSNMTVLAENEKNCGAFKSARACFESQGCEETENLKDICLTRLSTKCCKEGVPDVENNPISAPSAANVMFVSSALLAALTATFLASVLRCA